MTRFTHVVTVFVECACCGRDDSFQARSEYGAAKEAERGGWRFLYKASHEEPTAYCRLTSCQEAYREAEEELTHCILT